MMETTADSVEMPALLGRPMASAVAALHGAYFSRKLKIEERDNFDFTRWEEEILNHIEYLHAGPCRDVANHDKVTQCRCLADIRLGPELQPLVVQALIDFGISKKEQQSKMFFEWTLYAASTRRALLGKPVEERKKVYILPGSTGTMICRNAMARLLGYGRHAFRMILSAVKEGKPHLHGLNGNRNANSKVDFNAMMKPFFESLSEYSAPRATRIVHTVVNGVATEDLRDADVMMSELPPSFTKRRVYGRFLLEHGWHLKLDGKGKIIHMTKGDVVVDGRTSKEMPSWRSFQRYWKRNYPLITIQRPREDICNECYVFSNEHRFRDQRIHQGLDSDGSSEATNSDEDEKFNRMMEKEETINKAHKHVLMAKSQRDFFNIKKLEAKADVGKGNSDRCVTFVADYCQNMDMPHFGSEQPGETYYMSPLNVYTFGVVDCSTVPSHLAAYVYLEGEAHKKGGNGVVSLIWAELDRNNLLPPHPMLKNGCDEWIPLKELNLFFDNCGGQNKNRMVLRLLPLLVGLRVAKTVRASFLVRGHTKNDCDRLFNLLKKEYRNSNVYVPDDLIACLNSCNDVTAIRVRPDMFIDFDSTQANYFHQPTAINTNHIFTVHDSDPTVLVKHEFFGGIESRQTILLPKHNDTKWMNSHYTESEIEDPPGMKDIKWVELYSKIGKYVPENKRREWYPYHIDPGTVRKDLVKNQAKQSKKQRKERTVTVDSK
jgi:hypothetical protein